MNEYRNENHETLLTNKRVIAAATLALLLLCVFLFAQSLNAFKQYGFIGQDVPAMHTVTVSGSGEVFREPDTVQFSFSVIEEADTPAAAREAASEKINEAVAFVEAQGVEGVDRRTTSFDLSPRYEFNQRACTPGVPCPPGQRELVGFELRETVELKVHEIGAAGDIISGLADLGVQDISNLTFTVEDEEAAKLEAREAAIADAREQADALADALGVDLGRIVNFHEFTDAPQPFFAREEAEGLGGDAAAPLPAPAIEPGENRITSRVNIIFEID